VVGCVVDCAELFEATMRLRPDLVLLDFSLPGGLNGIEACRRLKAMAPDVDVVAFTAYDDPELKRLACEAGASGFVWKLQASDELIRTIRRLVDRKQPFSADQTA
jgi:DNA-binding NarL/FixJ family response regulator